MRLLLKIYLLLGLFLLPNVGAAQEWNNTYEELYDSGLQLRKEYKYQEAFPLFTNAYTIAIQNKDSVKSARALFEIGHTEYLVGSFEKSLNTLRKVSTEFETHTSPLLKGRTYNILGLNYARLGKREEAVETYGQGLAAFVAKEDSAIYALLYRNMSYSNQFLGNYELAVQNSDSAIKYVPKADLFELSSNYLSKYVSYLWLGKVQEAEPLLMAALNNAENIDNLSFQSQLYSLAGDYYWKRNNLNKTLIYYQKGLETATAIKRHLSIYNYHGLLGKLFLRLDNTDRAIPHLNIAHQYYESVGNELEDAEILMKLATAYRMKEDFEQSEQLLLKVYSICKRLENETFTGRAALALAELFLETGDQDKAQVYLTEGQEMGKNNDVYWLERDAQKLTFYLDDTLLPQHERLDLAKEFYSNALKLEPVEVLGAQTLLARAYHPVSSDSAILMAEETFDDIEQRRISMAGGVLKAGAFAQYSTFYNEVASWMASDRQDYSKTFELIEQAKARSLLDQLAEIAEESLTIIEEEEIQLLELQKRIDQLYRQKENKSSSDNQIGIDHQISSLQLEYDVLLEEIKANNPAWSAFAYPEVLSLDDIQDLIDKNTVVIEYAFTYTGLAILVITEKRVYFQLVEGDREIRKQLSENIDHFRNLIIAQASMDELKTASNKITQQILLPVLPHLNDVKNLVIVPDGELSLLPFDALVVNDVFLAKKMAIKLMPSISVFNLLPKPHRINEDSFFAIAGSGFEAGDGLFGINAQTAFATLPYTLIEVDSIATHFESPKVLKSEQVTEAAIKKHDLSEFKFLHFAAHGAINESEPTQSGLILSKKIQMENLFGEDGYLNASEIARLQLNADMVVLSSCNTATGKVLSGEGLLGLQRSFLTAGASSVVASLWSIYDRSTPVFMSHFYQYLIDFEHEELSWYDRVLIKMDWYEPELIDYKTLALQQAKLDMMEHPYYNHPVHWASFVITGK